MATASLRLLENRWQCSYFLSPYSLLKSLLFMNHNMQILPAVLLRLLYIQICLVSKIVLSAKFQRKTLGPEIAWLVSLSFCGHPEMKICWECTHPQIIQDVDEFISLSEQIWRNLALHYLLTNGSIRMRARKVDKNITSNLDGFCEVKSCMCVINPSRDF